VRSRKPSSAGVAGLRDLVLRVVQMLSRLCAPPR
jgi:hypothetical protein